MDGATFALLGALLLGIVGGIFIGYGWGRITERENGWKRFSNDPSDDAGA